MATLQFSALKPDVLPAVIALQLDNREKLRLVLEQVAIETIAYLRSLTEELRPPAPGSDAPRRAHPGHWADVTGQLAGAYSWEIEERSEFEIVLIFRNTAEHAVYLEVKEGFFVLSGVADPGGPVDQALRQIVPKLAPGWQVRLAA